VTQKFDADELRHILLHELAHLKRHDVAINWLASLLQAIHWFNPVIWLAMARLRNDRELAADELVLSLTAGEAPPRDAYGNTLVKLLQTLSAGKPALSGTVGILERAHPMRRRITMIAQFHGKFARRWTLAAAACMLVLLGVGLTDAVRGGDSKPAGPATTQKAATTSPSADDIAALRSAGVKRQARDAVEALLADGAITPEKLDKVKERLAQRLRAQLVIYDPKGQALNQQQVEAQITAINDEITRLAHQVMGPTTRGVASSAAPASVAADENQAAHATLDRILPELRFDAIGMSDVVDFLRDITGANIYVNWRALEAAGIDRNSPVTMRLRDIRFSQALGQLCRDVSGDGKGAKVEYAMEDRVLVISTTEELGSHPQLRSFDISDLLKPLNGSATMLEKVVQTQVPGATVTAFNDRLLVKGTASEIHGVEIVLNALREKK
jgi:hypothetical protein